MTPRAIPRDFGLVFGDKGLGEFVCVAFGSTMHSVNAPAAQMMIKLM